MHYRHKCHENVNIIISLLLLDYELIFQYILVHVGTLEKIFVFFKGIFWVEYHFCESFDEVIFFAKSILLNI